MKDSGTVINRKKVVRLSVVCSQPANSQQDHLENALRSYATWLVRAALQKLAESSSNNDRIDLTSEGNNRSNSLNDNRISMNEDAAI